MTALAACHVNDAGFLLNAYLKACAAAIASDNKIPCKDAAPIVC